MTLLPQVSKRGGVINAVPGSATPSVVRAAAVPTLTVTDGLVAWWKADPGSVGGVADGAEVSTWLDSSPSGYTASAASGQRPLWRQSAFNGQPALEFDGANDRFTMALSASEELFTYYAVLSIDNNTTKEHGILGPSANGGRDWRITTNGRMQLNWLGFVTIGQSPTSLPANTPVVVGVEYSGSAWAFSVNGSPAGSGTNSKEFGNGFTSRIGSGVNPDNFPIDGKIAEIICYHRLLSAQEKSSVVSYLGGKYGISVA